MFRFSSLLLPLLFLLSPLNIMTSWAQSKTSEKPTPVVLEEEESPDVQLTWQTRARGYLPLVSRNTLNGFKDNQVDVSEIGFTFIYPINTIFGIGGGYSYLWAHADKRQNQRSFFSTGNSKVNNSFLDESMKVNANFIGHFIEIMGDYKGFKLGARRILILTAGFELPISGEGRVSTSLIQKKPRTDENGKSLGGAPVSETITDKQKTSSVSGTGFFLSIGSTFGKTWEGFVYYRGRRLQYDVEIGDLKKTPSESETKTVLEIRESGVGMGVVF